METIYDLLANILGFIFCGILLYYAYAFYKQDKEFAEKDKTLTASTK